MIIGVRKLKHINLQEEEVEIIDFWEEAYTQTKIPHERLSLPPYNYVPVEVPDEYLRVNADSPHFDDAKFIQSSDFNSDLTFSQYKHDARILEETNNALRAERQYSCFDIVNRGQVWYEGLTEEQRAELKQWYKDWLDVTKTHNVPVPPAWLGLEKQDKDSVPSILWELMANYLTE